MPLSSLLPGRRGEHLAPLPRRRRGRCRAATEGASFPPATPRARDPPLPWRNRRGHAAARWLRRRPEGPHLPCGRGTPTKVLATPGLRRPGRSPGLAASVFASTRSAAPQMGRLVVRPRWLTEHRRDHAAARWLRRMPESAFSSAADTRKSSRSGLLGEIPRSDRSAHAANFERQAIAGVFGARRGFSNPLIESRYHGRESLPRKHQRPGRP